MSRDAFHPAEMRYGNAIAQHFNDSCVALTRFRPPGHDQIEPPARSTWPIPVSYRSTILRPRRTGRAGHRNVELGAHETPRVLGEFRPQCGTAGKYADEIRDPRDMPRVVD